MGRNGRWGFCAATIAAALIVVSCSQHYEEGSNPPPKQPPLTRLPAGHPPVDDGGRNASPEGTSQASVAALPEGAVTGTVRLAAKLYRNVPSPATLFIIASERSDGGPPYAVKRLPVPSFPHSFVLSQDDVIPMFGEGLQFAEIPEMFISARIDRDGLVGAMEPGEVDGALSSPVAAGDRGIEILIDTLY